MEADDGAEGMADEVVVGQAERRHRLRDRIGEILERLAAARRRPPAPGRSGRMTCICRPMASITDVKVFEVPPSPWIMTTGSPRPSISILIRSTNRVAISLFPLRAAMDAEHDAVDLVEVPLHLQRAPAAVALADRRDDPLMLVGVAATEIVCNDALLEPAPRPCGRAPP